MQDQHNWDTHKPVCQADYSDYATVQLESAIASELLKQAHERGIVFHTLVCDGDNYTVGSLNDSLVYGKLNIDQKIRKIECLSHVMRNMMNNLMNDQVEAGKSSLEEAPVESQSKEIKYMTRSISGRISHFYRLALEIMMTILKKQV